MKRLHFIIQNNLSQLHDEIIKANPKLAPVTDANGITSAVIRVEGVGDDVWVEVPDNFPDSAIQTVINAHKGTPPVRSMEF